MTAAKFHFLLARRFNAPHFLEAEEQTRAVGIEFFFRRAALQQLDRPPPEQPFIAQGIAALHPPKVDIHGIEHMGHRRGLRSRLPPLLGALGEQRHIGPFLAAMSFRCGLEDVRTNFLQSVAV